MLSFLLKGSWDVDWRSLFGNGNFLVMGNVSTDFANKNYLGVSSIHPEEFLVRKFEFSEYQKLCSNREHFYIQF